jgi:hypothetical protein
VSVMCKLSIMVNDILCSIKVCERPVRARGMCKGHYDRWSKGGDLTSPIKRIAKERLSCLEEECDRLTKARGRCEKHDKQNRRGRIKCLLCDNLFFRGKGQKFCRECKETARRNKPIPRDRVATKFLSSVPVEAELRFWSYVDIRGEDVCWEWTGGRNLKPNLPYGRFKFFGVEYKAHRIAFFLTHGVDAQVARHTCDNPPCCNPYHIEDGSIKDNVSDRYLRKRDRAQVADQHHSAKLTLVLAEEIRRRRMDGEKGQDLAKEFGVSQATISLVSRGLSYSSAEYVPRLQRG